MSQWLQWSVLTAVTGSPIGSILFLLVVWWAVDHFTFGFLPSPFRSWSRYRRATDLKNRLVASPHDRRARFELAELQFDQGRFAAAVETLRPNIERGDDDVYTLFVMGAASYSSGKHEDGEKLLLAAREKDAKFRMNAIDLELGRGRLLKGDPAGAVEALERLVAARPSTVEGRVLLARAYAVKGETDKAAQVKEDAWRDYAAAPGFQKRRERFWAWRAKPSRPLMYAAAGLVGAVLVVQTLGPVMAGASRSASAAPMDDGGE